MKFTNVKRKNTEPCAKKKLNTNRDIWKVSINWLGGTKKRKNGIQANGNDEDSVIIVD